MGTQFGHSLPYHTFFSRHVQPRLSLRLKTLHVP